MWFSENAWPPMILCVGAALVCGHYWRQTRRTVLLFAGLVMLLAAAGVYLLERQIVTDAEKVQARIFDLVNLVVKQTNAEPRDIQPVLAMLDPGSEQLRSKVQMGLNLVKVSDANVRDLNVQTAGEGRIEAVLRVNAKVNLNLSTASIGDIGYHTSRWRMVWVLIGEDWKLNDVQRLHPLKDEVVSITSID